MPIENQHKEELTAIEKMILDAKAKKEEIIQEGTTQARQLVDEAKQILAQAQEEAQKLVEQAKEQAVQQSDEIKDNAQKEGFDAGYKQGYEDGTKSLEEKVKAVDTFAQSQFDLKHNIVKSAELDIVELVCEIAQKVCKKSFENDIEVLKLMTTDAIRHLKDKESITLTINPTLAEKIYSISDYLKSEIPNLQSVKVLEDANVSDDGVIVESLHSRVDNRVKIQIDQIAEKFIAAHYSSDEDETESENKNEDKVEFEIEDKALHSVENSETVIIENADINVNINGEKDNVQQE